MSDWKLVVPVGVYNNVLNPSAETAGNFGNNAAAGISVTQSTTYAFRGLYSYKVATTATAHSGMYVLLKALTNAIHYITFWEYGTVGTLYASFYNGGGLIATQALTVLNTEGSWKQYGAQVPAATAFSGTGANKVYLVQTEATANTFYIDAIQVEALELWSTYVDGDQPGCKWEGSPHASRSYRGSNREGGYVRDLTTYYGMHIVNVRGYGGPTKESMLDPLAFVDGSVYQGTRASARILELTLDYEGTSLKNSWSKRKALMLDINRNKVWPQEPCLWYYTGAGKTVALRAFVESGDEGSGMGPGYHETLALTLMAVEDCYWEELAEETTPLSRDQTIAVEQMIAYRPDQPWNATTGYWDALGAPEMVDVAHGDETDPQVIYAMAKDNAGNLYVGGSFLNLNGVAAADYIAKRDVNGTWSALGSGTGGVVYALACDAAGNVYVGGNFTNVGGDADCDYVVMWNGAAFVQMGSGADGSPSTITVGPDGSVYVGGEFSTVYSAPATGVANTDGIAKWDGAAWSALGTGAGLGVGETVSVTMIDASGCLWMGGSFTNAGGVADTANIARWNGTAWVSIGVFDDRVDGLALGPSGSVYAMGSFTTIDGVSATRAAVYSGAGWLALGSGLNNKVYTSAATDDGAVYVAGAFTSAGGVTVADRVAMWNGTSWSALSVDLPGSATVYALLADGNDIYMGFDTEGDATAYGISTTGALGWVSNSGTAPAYPHITVTCTVAACTLQEITNHTTGQTLRFNRAMQVGETIFINCTKGNEGATSNFPPPNGSIVPLVLPSDLGSFCLLAGGNYVSAYAPGAGATVTVTMRWRIKHEGMEGGAT